MSLVRQHARGWSNGLLRYVPPNVPGSSALESREDWIAVYPPVIGSSHRPGSRTRDNFQPIRVGRGAFCRWYRVRYMPPSRVSTRLWPIRQRNCVSIKRMGQYTTAFLLRTIAGITSALVIFKLLDAEAGRLHEDLSQHRDDLVPLGGGHPFQPAVVE